MKQNSNGLSANSSNDLMKSFQTLLKKEVEELRVKHSELDLIEKQIAEDEDFVNFFKEAKSTNETTSASTTSS